MHESLTQPEGDNPLWQLQNPLFAGGLLWGVNLLVVNKEHQPINITANLAIPLGEKDANRRFRVSALSKPIYEYRDKQVLYFRPEHLAFPVYIEPGRHVNGHAEFAMDPAWWEAMNGDTLKKIVGGHEHILEVEDLLSGRKVEFNLDI